MKVLHYLCRIGLHAWGHEVEAKRYHHNKPGDKTKNALGPAKPIAQKCTRCGRRRIWSFNRGCWRPADPGRELGYENGDPNATAGAYELPPTEPATETAPVQSTQVQSAPVKSAS